MPNRVQKDSKTVRVNHNWSKLAGDVLLNIHQQKFGINPSNEELKNTDVVHLHIVNVIVIIVRDHVKILPVSGFFFFCYK